MPTYLLDTSVYCQPLKPLPLASVERHWRAISDDAIFISAICEAEILYGLEMKQSAQLNVSYERLLKNRFPVLPVDTSVASAFSRLKTACRKKGVSVPVFDLLIASTAKVHQLILATLNARHFQSIEGIAVEDWSKDPMA